MGTVQDANHNENNHFKHRMSSQTKNPYKVTWNVVQQKRLSQILTRSGGQNPTYQLKHIFIFWHDGELQHTLAVNDKKRENQHPRTKYTLYS